MSEIARGLLHQQAAQEEPDVGKVIKKMFPDVPIIDAAEERKRFEAEQQVRARLKALEAGLKK